MNPMISIIIPTANRPQFLLKAISSALEGMEEEIVEVIVVPNGPSCSWKEVLVNFESNSSVKFIPIDEANANRARNIGLKNARGDYVRFLDDDDFLIPAGAIKQYEVLSNSNADIVSGSVEIMSRNGEGSKLWMQPDEKDFCSAVLGVNRCCQPSGHVYRRRFIENLRWNTAIKIAQDIDWMISICLKSEVKWSVIPDVVGVWVDHSGARISTQKSKNEINKINKDLFISAYEVLLEQGRLSPQRKKCLVEGLWARVHAAYFLQPDYWACVVKKINMIDGEARPNQPIYNYFLLRNIAPLYILKLLQIKHRFCHKFAVLLRAK